MKGQCSSGTVCPHVNPVCSEYGYCQCASYRPGSKACQGGAGVLEANVRARGGVEHYSELRLSKSS